MRKKRAHYTSDEKVNIIRKHLLEKVPISDVCVQHKLPPTVFYRWQKQFFEHGARTFDGIKNKERSVVGFVMVKKSNVQIGPS